MHFRPLLLVLMTSIVCTSCTSTTTRGLITGDFQAILDATGGRDIDYSSLETQEVWALCQATAETRTFDEFDACSRALDARVATANGVLLYMVDGAGNRFHAVGATAQGMIIRMKAEVALMRGDLDAAQHLAQSLVDLTSTYDYPPDRRRLGNNIEGFPLIGSGSESAYSNIQRRKHLTEALGTLGLIAARARDHQTALAQAARIEAIEASGMNATQWRLPETRALWLARIYTTLGDYDRAYSAMNSINRSRLYGALKQIDNALTVINPVMAISYAELTGGLDMDAFYFTADFEPRFMLFRAALATGRIEEARAGYDSILAEDRVRGFGTVYWQALHGRGRIALLDGDPASAIQYFERAIVVIEAQRKSLASEAGRVGFIEDKQSVYADLIAVLVLTDSDGRAFEIAERAKARALVDLLSTQTAFATDPAVGNASVILERLDRLEAESLRLSRSGPGIAMRSAALETQRNALLNATPELATLVTVTDVDLGDIQNQLDLNETLLEYYQNGENLYAFVVTRTSIEVFELDGEELENDIAELREEVQDFLSDDYGHLLKDMYDRMISPLEHRLGSGPLTIVGHGALHYLPFAALHDGKRYLIESHELRLLPSASVARFLDQRGSGQRTLLALGNPDLGDPALDLPGAGRETRMINRDWADSRILLRTLASEANFRRYASSFEYLHLASHGEFNADHPLRSRMLLAPGGGEDGTLTASELYGLRLNANLVTLSACETGLGAVTPGDDVVGLTRGFLYAGAQSIITTLWPVSDAETAFLMSVFYEELKTNSKAGALRKAIRSTLARYPHPGYWSAFNLTGAR